MPPATVDSDGESDNSDRVPVPSFQNSFSQAIEAAFMKLDTPATADTLSGKGRGLGATCVRRQASLVGRFSLSLWAHVLVSANIYFGVSCRHFLHLRLVLRLGREILRNSSPLPPKIQ